MSLRMAADARIEGTSALDQQGPSNTLWVCGEIGHQCVAVGDRTVLVAAGCIKKHEFQGVSNTAREMATVAGTDGVLMHMSLCFLHGCQSVDEQCILGAVWPLWRLSR